MRGGIGNNSYANNSHLQRKASDMVKHTTMEVIEKVYLSFGGERGRTTVRRSRERRRLRPGAEERQLIVRRSVRRSGDLQLRRGSSSLSAAWVFAEDLG
ncbi:salicylate carboxymethyltransferase [Cucumis melo var. makuwa]|uniref:Salicylate carboxymethyltransferase n=1 Tax=Cucumis melo var. makuwa TaxID=1194695 RepID=A0A5A7TD43_CUCMM|nr:salicylate carboxymethyltransferase [Cucumis melo var. makuwa]